MKQHVILGAVGVLFILLHAHALDPVHKTLGSSRRHAANPPPPTSKHESSNPSNPSSSIPAADSRARVAVGAPPSVVVKSNGEDESNLGDPSCKAHTPDCGKRFTGRNMDESASGLADPAPPFLFPVLCIIGLAAVTVLIHQTIIRTQPHVTEPDSLLLVAAVSNSSAFLARGDSEQTMEEATRLLKTLRDAGAHANDPELRKSHTTLVQQMEVWIFGRQERHLRAALRSDKYDEGEAIHATMSPNHPAYAEFQQLLSAHAERKAHETQLKAAVDAAKDDARALRRVLDQAQRASLLHVLPLEDIHAHVFAHDAVERRWARHVALMPGSPGPLAITAGTPARPTPARAASATVATPAPRRALSASAAVTPITPFRIADDDDDDGDDDGDGDGEWERVSGAASSPSRLRSPTVPAASAASAVKQPDAVEAEIVIADDDEANIQTVGADAMQAFNDSIAASLVQQGVPQEKAVSIATSMAFQRCLLHESHQLNRRRDYEAFVRAEEQQRMRDEAEALRCLDAQQQRERHHQQTMDAEMRKLTRMEKQQQEQAQREQQAMVNAACKELDILAKGQMAHDTAQMFTTAQLQCFVTVLILFLLLWNASMAVKSCSVEPPQPSSYFGGMLGLGSTVDFFSSASCNVLAYLRAGAHMALSVALIVLFAFLATYMNGAIALGVVASIVTWLLWGSLAHVLTRAWPMFLPLLLPFLWGAALHLATSAELKRVIKSIKEKPAMAGIDSFAFLQWSWRGIPVRTTLSSGILILSIALSAFLTYGLVSIAV